MAAIAQRTDPYVGSHFFIEVEGIDHGGFSECTGLELVARMRALNDTSAG